MADTSIIIGSGFFDSINRDRLYSADDMNKPYKDLISEGVYGAIVGSTSTAFAVTPGTGLKVSVEAGHALLGGRWVELDEATTFDVPSNSSGSSRTDSVILRVDVNNSARNASLIYRTGSATAPALVTTAGITETRIANIIVANGASSISAGNITDERTFASLNVSTTQLAEVLYEIITEHPELITTVADGSITTAKLADGAVTLDKLAAAVITHFCLTNGYYINLTAGSAEQLISTVTIEDKVPYQFRTSGGSADIGDRETDKIVGGTIAFNQLIQNGDFADTSAWNKSGSVTFTVANNVGTVTQPETTALFYMTNLATVVGHKYLLSASVKLGTASNTWIAYGLGKYAETPLLRSAATTNWQTLSTVLSLANVNPTLLYLRETSVANQAYDIKNVYLIDLTQMFGSTIADYIYSLEQATPGAGVAWFKKLFPNPYYAYNAGELMHVSGLSAHKMVGFNAWDEEWELGDLEWNTYKITPSATGARFCPKNFIPVIEGQRYYVTVTNGNVLIGYESKESNGVYLQAEYGVLTIPSGIRYIKFAIITSSYGTTYKNDICISLYWDGERAGEYESYEEWVYPLDDSLLLRGIPKLDANNQMYYDGDTYESDGTVTRRYGIVDLGTLNWTKGNTQSSYRFIAYLNGLKNTSGADIPNMVCTKYNAVTANDTWTSVVVGITSNINNSQVMVMDTSYSDEATFKTAMSGVYLVYELATPTTETADPFTNPQVVDNFGTEEYVTTSIVPVGHETSYPADLKAKLEMLPNSPDGDGDYIMRQTNGENVFVPLVIEDALPQIPSTDGTYTLKATVADGEASLSWVADA